MLLAEPGSLADLVHLLGMRSSRPALDSDADAPPITRWRVHQEATLLHEGSRSDAVYVVRCGSLKCIKTPKDGYEQVRSFALPGDLLGFEALHSGIQPAGVVALEDSSVYALPVGDLPMLQDRVPVLAGALNHALSRQLLRATEAADLMSAVASEVRLARF